MKRAKARDVRVKEPRCDAGCQTTQAELSLHDAFGRSDLCWHMGRSSQHTLMVAWPTRIILVVSYTSAHTLLGALLRSLISYRTTPPDRRETTR